MPMSYRMVITTEIRYGMISQRILLMLLKTGAIGPGQENGIMLMLQILTIVASIMIWYI